MGSDQGPLTREASGAWWFTDWSSLHVRAGVTDRRTEAATLVAEAAPAAGIVEAEQVHGGSVALVEQLREPTLRIPGCDALLTRMPEVALLIRTADCLPLYVCDPIRWAVGLAHAGWRGLVAGLPLRLIAFFQYAFHSQPADLWVAIGPAIRACCYEVGPEFSARFGRFVRKQDNRYRCDLIGIAMEQLRQGGIRSDHVIDSGQCTACESQSWYSLRREGQAAGRLTSLIMLRP